MRAWVPVCFHCEHADEINITHAYFCSLEKLRICSHPQKASLYVMEDKASMRWLELENKNKTSPVEFNMLCVGCIYPPTPVHSRAFRRCNLRVWFEGNKFSFFFYSSLIALKGHTSLFSWVSSPPPTLSSTAPVFSNTFGAQLEVNNVWARRRIRKPLWTFCLSACLSVFYPCFLTLAYLLVFFSIIVELLFLTVIYSVSCSEVCRLWPRRSGAVWMQ